MDQVSTWHAGRPQPWPDCFKWAQSPIFGPCSLWSNGWMD